MWAKRENGKGNQSEKRFRSDNSIIRVRSRSTYVNIDYLKIHKMYTHMCTSRSANSKVNSDLERGAGNANMIYERTSLVGQNVKQITIKNVEHEVQ